MRPFCVSRYKKLQLVVVHWFTSSFIITVELTGLSFVEVGLLHCGMTYFVKSDFSYKEYEMQNILPFILIHSY